MSMPGARVLLFLALVTAAAVMVSGAQAGISITSAYAREITVDGRADPAGEKVTIYDTSYEAQTRLGEGEISREGNFAVAVRPALIQDHVLVAVDKNGRRSEPFTVGAPRSGDVPALPH